MASPEAPSNLLTEASLQFAKVRPLLPLFSHIILSALFPIFTGAHASLSRPSSAAKPDKKRKDVEEEEDEDEDKVQKMEGLSNKDAIVLPLTAGLTLTGLYFLIMKYGAEIINLVIGYYFAAIGIFSVGRLINDASNVVIGFVFPNYFQCKLSREDKKSVLVRVLGSQRKVVIPHEGNDEVDGTKGLPFRTPFPRWTKHGLWRLRQTLKQKYVVKGYVHNILDFALNLTLINVASGLLGLGIIVYVNTISRLWFFTNLQGFALSYQALQLLSPTSFTTGSLILSALFFYDIWAVFYTPLMVGVAKNLHQPIALVFPRPPEPSTVPGEPPVRGFSMLGLGDIVIPGIVIGLALRFDLYMFYLKKQKQSKDNKKAPYVSVTGRWGDKFWTSGLSHDALPPHLSTAFPKPYFFASVGGYVAGMVTTLGIMTIFHHAQPALLYLVPGVLVSLWGTGLVRGEVGEMWEFSEAVTAEPAESEEDGEKEREAKKEESSKGLFERMWHDLWHGGDEKQMVAAPAANADADEPLVSKTNRVANKEAKKAANADNQNQEKKKAETKEKNDPGLLFSFTISRYTDPQPKSTLPSINNSIYKAMTSSAASSENSEEDPVLVSSADLDGTQEAEGSVSARLRTRGAKGRAS